MRLRQLERILSGLEGFESPDPGREQYQTPAGLAARLLFDAAMQGDIAGRRVLDLGCGTGILAIGAGLLGAESVTGVDIDPRAVGVAIRNAGKCRLSIDFFVREISPDTVGDVSRGQYDTVVMNPPFGAQKIHADRPFIDYAVRVAARTYGIFNAGSLPFVSAYIGDRARVTSVTRGRFPLRKTFSFHTCECREIDVEIIRIEAEP